MEDIKIVVVVEDSAVRDVRAESDLPCKVVVEVRDYDTEGNYEETANLPEDEDGTFAQEFFVLEEKGQAVEAEEKPAVAVEKTPKANLGGLFKKGFTLVEVVIIIAILILLLALILPRIMGLAS